MATETHTDTDSLLVRPHLFGEVVGAPRLLLRLEGFVVLAAAAAAYGALGQSWVMFALLFFVADASMLGYLVGRRVGTAVYNFGHSYLAPLGLCALAHAMATEIGLAVGLIWIAHIGFDRAVGYGLKYATGFRHTHLGAPFGGPTVRSDGPA